MDSPVFLPLLVPLLVPFETDLLAPLVSVLPVLWLSDVLSLEDVPVLLPFVVPSLTELL